MLAEQSLRQGENRLRFIMESIPQKILTATPDGAVDYYNPQWFEYTGLTFDQIKGSGWKQFVHPDDLGESVRASELPSPPEKSASSNSAFAAPTASIAGT